MGEPVLIMKHPKEAYSKSVSIKMTPREFDNLMKLSKEFNEESISSTIRLWINFFATVLEINKEAEDYMSVNDLTLHNDSIDALKYLSMFSKAWTFHIEKSTFSRLDFIPTKIIQNGPAFIVFWGDKTKTVLKRKDGDQDDPYAAFGQALMIKMFRSNSAAHKIVDRVTQYRDMEVVR